MLETDRLKLRKLKDSDVEFIYSMRSDPEVMRFIREPQNDVRDSARWIHHISSFWDSDGIGYCILVEKETLESVGWCGLWRIKETDEIEVGYAVSRDRWGRGYATEAAAAFLDYGFGDLGLNRIVAVAYPENQGSINVMLKLGMKYQGVGIFYEKRLVQYATTVVEWEGRNDRSRG